MIHKQLTKYFKVKLGFILIGYYKSHGVGIRVFRGSVLEKEYAYAPHNGLL